MADELEQMDGEELDPKALKKAEKERKKEERALKRAEKKKKNKNNNYLERMSFVTTNGTHFLV